MPRLFIGPREINFVEDIGRELLRDINGQQLHYYAISESKTRVHEIYGESPEKIFDNPIQIECLAQAFTSETVGSAFGNENKVDVEAYVQSKDLLDRKITVQLGDFFSYGRVFFEIVKLERVGDYYGHTENEIGVKLFGKKARKDTFIAKIVGPTDEKYLDADAIQNKFKQTRGYPSDENGLTGDVRSLQQSGVLDKPLSGPREVSKLGDASNAGSAFYDEDE